MSLPKDLELASLSKSQIAPSKLKIETLQLKKPEKILFQRKLDELASYSPNYIAVCKKILDLRSEIYK